MSTAPKNMEFPGMQPDPVKLLEDLTSLNPEQKKNNFLRDIFIEEADVDEYIRYLDKDENVDLTRSQLKQLKETLAGFKEYIKDYLEKTGKRIGRFDERQKKIEEEMANPDLTRENVRVIAHARERVAQAMHIAKAPRGAKGKSLREVTEKGSVSGVETKKELSPEEIDQYLQGLKVRFDLLPQLHEGVLWADVEAALKKFPKAVKKLRLLDGNGFEMNVFKSKNPTEIIFRTAQLDVTKIDKRYRTIMYDQQAEKDNPQYEGTHNAIDLAASLGCELADPELYEQLRVQNGWVWLKTDAQTRKSGRALFGYRYGVSFYEDPYNYYDTGALCPSLRVKKA